MDTISRRIAGLFLEQYGDVPIPAGREIFTRDEVKELEKTHFVVELSGKSLKDLVRENDKIAIWTASSFTAVDLDLPSRVGHVALPKELFLQGSGYRVYAEQEAMIEAHAAQTRKRPGLSNLREIVGQVADYAEAVRKVHEKYRKELFGINYGYNYTVALLGSGLVVVGNLCGDRGLYVGTWRRDLRRDDVLVSPLVVPA